MAVLLKSLFQQGSKSEEARRTQPTSANTRTGGPEASKGGAETDAKETKGCGDARPAAMRTDVTNQPGEKQASKTDARNERTNRGAEAGGRTESKQARRRRTHKWGSDTGRRKQASKMDSGARTKQHAHGGGVANLGATDAGRKKNCVCVLAVFEFKCFVAKVLKMAGGQERCAR